MVRDADVLLARRAVENKFYRAELMDMMHSLASDYRVRGVRLGLDLQPPEAVQGILSSRSFTANVLV